MIKNLLYSLFLHFLLLLVIYLNFNLHKIEKNETSEIAVSLMTLKGEETANSITPSASKEEAKPKEEGIKKIEEAKEAESAKISETNQIKKTPKKLAKAKAAKAVKKTTAQEKIEEFKLAEKEEIKQEDAKKPQKDESQNQQEDKEENEVKKKEEDVGAKKDSTKESEVKKEENPQNSAAVNMANSLDNLDLSSREKFNIQSQLQFCYHAAISESKFEGNSKIIVKVQVNRDGEITANIDELIDQQQFNDPTKTDYQSIITNVQRALDLCSPLRNLPIDKYDIWKEVVLEFGE